jgi:hypothetical protein
MNIGHWRCWLGHNWSSWAHIPSRCVDERFCKNCPEVERVLNHRWGQWEVSNGNTNFIDDYGKILNTTSRTIQIRTCEDCNYKVWEDY